MKKHFALLLLFTVSIMTSYACFSTQGIKNQDDEEITYTDIIFEKEKQVISKFVDRFVRKPFSCCIYEETSNTLFDGFVPTTYITEQTDEDKLLRSKMSALFFERRNQGLFASIFNNTVSRDPDAGVKESVYQKSIKQYDAQEVMLLTEDAVRISSLLFERKNSPINILYVVGYFRGNTPSKEWAAPFAEIFPDYTLMSFDWRGYAQSDGHPSQFDTEAYKDVQAAIDYLRKLNDKPIVVVGFCLGSALALKAELEAQKKNAHSADAFVLNSTPTYVNCMKERVPKVAPNWFLRMFYGNHLVLYTLWERMMGNLAALEPYEMIKQINKPMLFEYYTHDIMVPWHEGIDNFTVAPTEKKMITFSDIGSHVRIHAKAPAQYRQTFNNFLEYSGILSL